MFKKILHIKLYFIFCPREKEGITEDFLSLYTHFLLLLKRKKEKEEKATTKENTPQQAQDVTGKHLINDSTTQYQLIKMEKSQNNAKISDRKTAFLN